MKDPETSKETPQYNCDINDSQREPNFHIISQNTASTHQYRKPKNLLQ